MSVWIQSLFSALLPLPPKLMWQKMENHEWLCLRLVWSTVTTVLSHDAQEDKCICHWGKKRMSFPDSHCSARGFVFPRQGGARSQRVHLPSGGQTWGTSTCGTASGVQLLPWAPCTFCRRRGWSLPSIQEAESLLGSFHFWWGVRLLEFPTKLDMYVMTNSP